MTSALYVCAEAIQEGSGGGLVVTKEREALRGMGFDRVTTIAGDEIDPVRHQLPVTPFLNDMLAAEKVWAMLQDPEHKPILAHFYSGSFSTTVRHLKAGKIPVSYTIPAHERRVTIEEHKRLTGGYPWPHIGDDYLWEIFSAGYREADLVIAPSKASAAFLEAEACRNVQVIPHGCTLPDRVEPLPLSFAAGYMGQAGVDKGLVYLLRAWGKLNYPDATLILAGVGSAEIGFYIQQVTSGGKYALWGYIPSVDKFYNAISVYVQPSVCEGFGIEVLEAMACFPGDTIFATSDVFAIHRRKYTGVLIKVGTARGNIVGTPEHPLWANNHWVMMKDLRLSDRLLYNAGYAKEGVHARRADELGVTLSDSSTARSCSANGQNLFLGLRPEVQARPKESHECSNTSQDTAVNRRRMGISSRSCRWRRNCDTAKDTQDRKMEAIGRDMQQFYGNNGLAEKQDQPARCLYPKQPWRGQLHIEYGGHILPAHVQETRALSDNQEKADGSDYQMVGIENDAEPKRPSALRTRTDLGRDTISEFETITSVEAVEVRELPVYNLTTTIGIYFANGYLVHNCGRPVIVSQGAGAADVVSEGVDGFTVPIRDPDALAERIQWCRQNPAKLQEMGVKAREKATAYTWPIIQERYRDAWRKLLTSS